MTQERFIETHPENYNDIEVTGIQVWNGSADPDRVVEGEPKLEDLTPCEPPLKDWR
jgi:hypothetical protein